MTTLLLALAVPTATSVTVAVGTDRRLGPDLAVVSRKQFFDEFLGVHARRSVAHGLGYRMVLRLVMDVVSKMDVTKPMVILREKDVCVPELIDQGRGRKPFLGEELKGHKAEVLQTERPGLLFFDPVANDKAHDDMIESLFFESFNRTDYVFPLSANIQRALYCTQHKRCSV